MVFKLGEVVTSFDFTKDIVDQCIYHKVSGSKFVILVLYIDEVLLVNDGTSLLHETKRMLSENKSSRN